MVRFCHCKIPGDTIYQTVQKAVFTTCLSFYLFFSVSIKEIKDLEEDRQTNRDTDRMISKYVKAW